MLPKKLKNDSIVEAMCILQFETSNLSEIIIGRLSDSDLWSGYSVTRLPVSDIPTPIRKADDNLRYAPLLQLKSSDNVWLAQIGDNIISLHILGKYCGWNEFQSKLESTIELLFSKINDIVIKRIGLRYINALCSEKHYIEGIHSLNVNISVAESKIENAVNLNYITNNNARHLTLTRIATSEFVKGNMPNDVNVTIDVDVYTPESIEINKKEDVFVWINEAHEIEKTVFFNLLPQKIIDDLTEI